MREACYHVKSNPFCPLIMLLFSGSSLASSHAAIVVSLMLPFAHILLLPQYPKGVCSTQFGLTSIPNLDIII